MTKKGMTKGDIYLKLETLKTDEGRYSYLKKISKKAGRLSPETRKAFYETLGDYALKTGNLNDATDAYQNGGMIAAKIGTKKEAIRYAEKLAKIGETDKRITADLYNLAGRIAAKVGAKKEARGYVGRLLKEDEYRHDDAVDIELQIGAIKEALAISNGAPWAAHARTKPKIERKALEDAEKLAKKGEYSKAIRLAAIVGASEAVVKYAKKASASKK
jgi:tetratricopeptide (TPR) repeat protein